MSRPSAVLCAAALAVSTGLSAQTAGTVTLTVAERAGIRRTSFPVGIVVPIAQGALQDAGHVRLVHDGVEAPAQFAAESSWPDGSVRNLSVDFNASIGALATDEYRLEYGPGIAAAPIARGLQVTEDETAIQVGNFRLGRSGRPLLVSVKYRGEDIAPGVNGLRLTGRDGRTRDFGDAVPLDVNIVKRGPLRVVVRYSGEIELEPHHNVPFALDVELPNSKSWAKFTATVEDPEQSIAEVALHTPVALGRFPWSWDVGTDRGTYGAFRRATDTMAFRQLVTAPGEARWQASAGAAGEERQEIETTGETPGRPARWFHLQSEDEAVAFAIAGVGEIPGVYRVALDGTGQTMVAFAPSRPTTSHRLIVYEHFVASPLAIGAATSPASALSPLDVAVQP